MDINIWEMIIGICAVVGIIGGMFRFFWYLIEDKFKDLTKMMTMRFDDLEKRFDKVDQRFNILETKIDNVDIKVSDLNVRVTIVETRLEERQAMKPRIVPSVTGKRRPGRPPLISRQ